MAKRQFDRPPPGNRYTEAERKAWGAEQDRLRALRNAPDYQKPAPARRQSRAKTLVADTSGSSCFDSLVYRNGVVTAVFAKDGSEYDYGMSLADARDWFSDGSLGGFFNDEVR
jgi:hypothetical protein